jgi:hypothetical protein
MGLIKKLLSSVVLFAALMAPVAHAAHVQNVHTGGSVTTINITPVTTGNLLVLSFHTESSSTPTVSDNHSNTWTMATNTNISGSFLSTWYAFANTNAATTITVTPSNAFNQLAVDEYSNVTAFDTSVTTTGTSAGTVTKSITVGSANELIVSAIDGFHSSNTFTANSPFTLGGQNNGADALATSYFSAATSGTYTSSFTISGGSTQYNLPVLAFTTSTFSVSGSIPSTATPTNIAVKSGSTIVATTSVTGSTSYTISGIPNGSYTIVPAGGCINFSPATISITVSGANLTGENFTTGAGSAPCFVQSAGSSTTTTATSKTLTLTGITAGDALVVMAVCNASPYPGPYVSLTDSASNGFKVVSSTNSTFASAVVAVAGNVSAGSDTITYTCTGAGQITMYVQEFSGVDSKPLEGASLLVTSTSASLSSEQMFAPVGDLVVGMVANEFQPGSIISASSGYTTTGNVVGATNGVIAGFYQASVGTTYSNTASISGGTQASFNEIITLRAPTSSTPRFLQAVRATSSTAVSSLAFPSITVTAGDTLLVSATGGTSPSVSGCGATWNLLSSTINNASATVFYATNVSAGACAPTVSYTSSVQACNLLLEYTGVSTTYTPDVWTVGSGSGAIATTGSNEVLVSLFSTYQIGSQGQFSGGSGSYIYRLETNAGSQFEEYAYDQVISSPTSFSFTTSGGFGSGVTNVGFLVVGLRSATPTFGEMQTAFKSGTATTQTLTLPFPVTSGDTLILAVTSANSSYPIVSDNKGNTWTVVPYVNNSGDVPQTTTTFYATNVAAGATTISVTETGAPSVTYDLNATEVIGLGNASPFVAVRNVQPNSTQNTQTDSITLGSGNYYLYSLIGDNDTSQFFYTNSSGWVQRGYPIGSHFLKQVWDESVTAGTYSSHVATSGSFTNNLSTMLVFSAANNSITVPHRVQTMNGGTFAGANTPTATLVQNITSGHLLVVIGAWQSGTGTISDSLSNSWTLLRGGGTNGFGVWYTTASSSGADTVTLTTTDLAALQVIEIAGTHPSIDTSNGATVTSTSAPTGSITTAGANELIISFYLGAGPAIIIADSGAPFYFGSYGYSHGPITLAWEQFATTSGSFSDTMTQASSGLMNVGILAIKVLSTGGQPIVDIIMGD